MPRTLDDGTEVFTKEELDAEVEGLKANQKKALDEAKAAKRALSELKDQWGDLDPKEVKTLVDEAANAKRDQQKNAGDWEAREQALTDAHQKQIDAMKSRQEKLMRTVEQSLKTSKLTTAIAAAKGDVDLLLPHAERFVEVQETDDGFEAFVTDGQGNRAVSDGRGSPMTFDQLVEAKLIPAYPRAFEGTGSSGSGASRSADGVGRRTMVAADDDDAFIANVDKIASGEVEVR